MRVLQARYCFGLNLEAQPFGGAGVLDDPDHLQRNHAIVLEPARPVDDAHAAAAQNAKHFVARNFGVLAALARRLVRGNGAGVSRYLWQWFAGTAGVSR
jgi:hypothetical protein